MFHPEVTKNVWFMKKFDQETRYFLGKFNISRKIVRKLYHPDLNYSYTHPAQNLNKLRYRAGTLSSVLFANSDCVRPKYGETRQYDETRHLSTKTNGEHSKIRLCAEAYTQRPNTRVRRRAKYVLNTPVNLGQFGLRS